VVRNMIMGRKQADLGESPIMKIENESKERKVREESRAARAESKAAEAAPQSDATKPASETSVDAEQGA